MKQSYTQLRMRILCFTHLHAVSIGLNRTKLCLYKRTASSTILPIFSKLNFIYIVCNIMFETNRDVGGSERGHVHRITSAGKHVLPDSPPRFPGRDGILPSNITHFPKTSSPNINIAAHPPMPKTSTTMARSTAARIRAYQQYLDEVERSLDSGIQEATRKMTAKEKGVRDQGGMEMEAILQDKATINKRREVRQTLERVQLLRTTDTTGRPSRSASIAEKVRTATASCLPCISRSCRSPADAATRISTKKDGWSRAPKETGSGTCVWRKTRSMR